MRRFVISDIHGAHKALTQCLVRSGFDPDTDMLICLGDVCDRNPDVRACFDTLLQINHLVYVLGNHDLWARRWGREGRMEDAWLLQGGWKTVASYAGTMDAKHLSLLNGALAYFEMDQMLFVHGGYDPMQAIGQQDIGYLAWSRDLVYQARSKPEFKFKDYKKVFVGHTPTQQFGADIPLSFCGSYPGGHRRRPWA